MTEPLAVWREKLAGVTPGPMRAAQINQEQRPFAVISSSGPHGDVFLAANIWGPEDAAHIVRSDRLSRVLADETTVEGLARVLCKASVEHGQAEGVEANPAYVDKYWPEYVTRALAVLNHLAQLALGDGT